MKIKFVKVDEHAQMPTKAHETDACYDLYVTKAYMEKPGVWVTEFGLKFEIERNWFEKLIDRILGRVPYLAMYSRSSIDTTGLELTNGKGIVDLGCRGEPKAKFYVKKGNRPYTVGDRSCQCCIEYAYNADFVEVDELSESDRGKCGFGSTGR